VGLQLKVKKWRAIVTLVLVISTYIMVFFATVTQADSDSWAAVPPFLQLRGDAVG